jgi:hypothetical protein
MFFWGGQAARAKAKHCRSLDPDGFWVKETGAVGNGAG